VLAVAFRCEIKPISRVHNQVPGALNQFSNDFMRGDRGGSPSVLSSAYICCAFIYGDATEARSQKSSFE
jgi:hypothetical protein